MNYENDNHQHTEYVKASTRYRCGRAAKWGKPCWQGPNAKKKCGGTSECRPIRRGDRYYCQRPKSAGGACVEGPLADGVCAHTHLPCRPHTNIRWLRGKLALFGVLVLIILIAVFSNRDSGALNNTMINPGDLSSAHAGFPITDQCENCHEAHDQPATSWLLSAFSHKDLSNQCVQCHAFNGEAKTPHNQSFDQVENKVEVACISCHREHKGSDFDISKVTNQTCGNCHEQSFMQLAEHTDFSSNYPHQQPQNIFFDHAKHLSEYFVEEEWIDKPGRDALLAKKAASECSFCHQVEIAQRDVPVRDYQIVCAGCHEQQIKTRAMTILTADDISPAFMQLFISNEAGDEAPEAYEFAAELINEMGSDGLKAISERLDDAGITENVQQHLFTGLDSGLLKRTARLWLDEAELSSDDGVHPGWQAAENDDGSDAIFYRPDGHADNVMRSWIELYLNRVATDDDANAEVLAELLDVESGSGACGKCHGSMAGSNKRQASAPHWGKTSTQQRKHTPGFSHRPHIDLLGKSTGCDACHKLSDTADYPQYFKQAGIDADAFQSGFKGIKKETCIKCHNPERISDDCQLCHVYHNDAGFKFEYQEREMKVINHE